MKLLDKRIVITGGTSGIGLELIKQLHGDNELIIIARDADKIASLKSEFSGLVTFQTDLANLDEVKLVGSAIAKKHKHIDVIINNAAVQNTPLFTESDFNIETIEAETNINFIAPSLLIYKLLPLLLWGGKQTSIVNINSGLALTPKTTSAIYCATKGGLNTLSLALRNQLINTNVKVQQAFLPLVDTSMTKGRGTGKLTATAAAKKIIKGVENEVLDNDIGKVKLLRFLSRFFPYVAKKIMRGA